VLVVHVPSLAPKLRHMADPLSIAASAIAVATLAAQVTTTLSKLRTLYELPGRLQALHNEVTDLEVVLRQIGLIVKERDLPYKKSRHGALQNTLQRGNTKLVELNAVIQRLEKSCVGGGKRYLFRAKAWWLEQPRLQALQEELRTIKATPNVMPGATHS